MKNISRILIVGLLFLGSIVFTHCKKDDLNTLTLSKNLIEFKAEGGSASFTINTDAGFWQIENPASDWLLLSSTSGTGNVAMISLSVSTKTIEPRVDTLLITAGNAKAVELIVTQASSEYLYSLTASPSSLSFKRVGNTIGIKIVCEASEWTLKTDVDWLSMSELSGAEGTTDINIIAAQNVGVEKRSATITLSAEFAPTIQIAVTQSGEFFPSYNSNPIEADSIGMSSSATELAAKIKLGWNVGNSLEASGSETNWGNPRVSKALIDLVKQNGFNAIRIPCSWSQYLENTNTAKIKSTWLARVKEVIQYGVDNDMYVILNIHWDGGWLEEHCTDAAEEKNNAQQKAFWEQIATYMRDFDEHLMFASANEPHADNAAQMAVLKSYHQTFINAVRSTGGKNIYRTLVIQGPHTDIYKTNTLMTSLPTDQTANRMMTEIHFYTPWDFCGQESGSMVYYWGDGYHSDTETDRNATWGEESEVDKAFGLMKAKFTDKNIPVVLGEYGVMRRSYAADLTLANASRAYYLEYVTRKAKENGLLPFYWDNGGTGNNSFGVFNRSNNTVFDQQAVDAIVAGATK